MKKLTILAACAAVFCAGTCMAGPHHGRFHHRGPAPVHFRGGHVHHHGHGWGPGFVGGLVGGLVGGIVHDVGCAVHDVVTAPIVAAGAIVSTASPGYATVPAPVTTYTPAPVGTCVNQNVWVEGRYVDQVQPNGVIYRVFVPGHYEQRPVYYR